MPSEDPRFAPRPPVRFERPRLSDAEIESIRRDRLRPRITRGDYVHLAALRRALASAIRQLGEDQAPVLDLFCGTKPYLELLPWRPTWGLDLDAHFGRADVIGSLPLPFRNDSIGLVWCTQALYLADDPIGVVNEAARVLRPQGHAIISILSHFWAESDAERHWSPADLAMLFAGWEDVRVLPAGGPAAAIGLTGGRALAAVARRWPSMEAISVSAIVVMNTVLGALDLLASPRRRWPHGLVLIAKSPQPTTS
jgi:SAM-dependent methyltransferase